MTYCCSSCLLNVDVDFGTNATAARRKDQGGLATAWLWTLAMCLFMGLAMGGHAVAMDAGAIGCAMGWPGREGGVTTAGAATSSKLQGDGYTQWSHSEPGVGLGGQWGRVWNAIRLFVRVEWAIL